ncbi:tetratricopeptide repeat protein [Desulfotomaculum copahuensis]|uniref:Tetratricopeptide repeat protein n=1 Tax=Desulfotomaculum copahuensis TaxID=1838280 RepID=A0A1B7LE32_9FIRM|nr:tetratricopeptide repeat protein [Desulfotomaculum copahuensis]OAT81346.1 hypothetical protein A6M21_10720 [Desulfotomaculum copahuensis]
MWNPLPTVRKAVTVAYLWQAGARILEVLGAEEQALRWIDRAVKLEPRRVNLHLQATRLCLKRGRLDRAILHWKKAAGEHSRTSLLYWLNRVNQRSRTGDRLLKKHLALEEENRRLPAPNKSRPVINENKKSFSGPLGLLNKLLVEPETLSLNDVGINLLAMDRPEEALTVFRQVQATTGPDPALYLNTGLALSKLNRHEEALLCYQRAQAGGLNSVELMNNKGYSLHFLGRLEEAITCYEVAKELSPGDASILANLAGCYQRARMYRQALSCYENALICNPDDPTAMNNYALCLDEMNRHEEALKLYNRALSIEPFNQTVLLNKAACLNKLHRYSESLAICEGMLKQSPDCPETWGLLGNLHNEMGRAAEAVKCYSRALGLVH